MIRIAATSDLHGRLPDVPACDLLIIGGDICPGGSMAFQKNWLDTACRDWLEKIPAKEIIAIAGNHDLIFEQAPHLVPKDMPWYYLEDSEIELQGFKFYGTPWQLPFWGAFNLDEKGLALKYRNIPHDVDILISHGPPFGIGDEVPAGHQGSVSLRDKIFEIKPKLVVYGHIHPAFGMWKIDDIIFANVSLLNDAMEIVNKPVLFERV